MRLAGCGVDETARQCELVRGTEISAHKAYLDRIAWHAAKQHKARSALAAITRHGLGRRLAFAREGQCGAGMLVAAPRSDGAELRRYLCMDYAVLVYPK